MKIGKILLYVVPPVAVITVIYLINKQSAKKKLQQGVNNSPLLEQSSKTSGASTASNDFPLKKGSRNDSVKTLQRILGVSDDGIFGSQTEAALQAFSGKTTVASQSELDALAAKKTTQQNQVVSIDRAKQLLTQFQSGNLNIYTTADLIAYGYVEDYSGAIKYNSKNITLPKAKRYGNTDYKLINYTKAGNLEMQVMSGDFAGTYIINPNIITLVK